MAFAARRAALRTARTQRAPITRQFRRTYAEEAAEEKNILKTGAKRDPELYVCLFCPAKSFNRVHGSLG